MLRISGLLPSVEIQRVSKSVVCGFHYQRKARPAGDRRRRIVATIELDPKNSRMGRKPERIFSSIRMRRKEWMRQIAIILSKPFPIPELWGGTNATCGLGHSGFFFEIRFYKAARLPTEIGVNQGFETLNCRKSSQILCESI